MHKKYNVVNYGVAAATHLRRRWWSFPLSWFSTRPCQRTRLHHFKNDRVDHYWREIFKLLKDAAGGVRQLEWELLVKLCCTLSHGNQLSRRYKSGYAWISGHLWEIAQITPKFLWFCPDLLALLSCLPNTVLQSHPYIYGHAHIIRYIPGFLPRFHSEFARIFAKK